MKITEIMRFKDNMSIQELADYCVKHMEWVLNSHEVNGNDRELWKVLQKAILAHLVNELEDSEPQLTKAMMKTVDHLQEASSRDRRAICTLAEALQSLAESKGLEVVIGVWDGKVPYCTSMSRNVGEDHLASLSRHPRFQREFPFPATPEPMGDD